MAESVPAINFSKRLLMGPGPSEVDSRVYRAMSQPVIGHMDPVFLEILGQLQQMLREAFRTRNRVTFPIAGTGSAGMEAALINFLEPGDEAAVVVGGVFAGRMCEIIERCGGKLTRMDTPWGVPADPDRVRQTLRGKKIKLLAVVHSETSTGVLQPLEPLRQIALEADQWALDVCYSGSQKCLGCPPGLAPITVSEPAMEILRKRRGPVQSWYLDLSMVEKYWGPERSYHHTPPVNMLFGLHEALRLLQQEGLAAAWERHRRCHRALVRGAEALGLKMFVEDPAARAWTVNTILIPDGVDDARVRARLLERFQIEIAGGLGQLKGRIWRVGLMGLTATPAAVLLLFGALESVLAECGYRCDRGAGVAAAEDAFSSIIEDTTTS